MGRRKKAIARPRMVRRPVPTTCRYVLANPEWRVPPVENHIVNLYEMPEYAHLAPSNAPVVSLVEHKNCMTCARRASLLPDKEELDSGHGTEDDNGLGMEYDDVPVFAMPMDPPAIVRDPNGRQTAIRSYRIQMPNRQVTDV